mmetsp:Transcript_46802/g.74684  ORF Transcript_46802/g.74684 Transcript_46802/m.74684 type:complete len:237 (-) Transcript_46802:79-789(-)
MTENHARNLAELENLAHSLNKRMEGFVAFATDFSETKSLANDLDKRVKSLEETPAEGNGTAAQLKEMRKKYELLQVEHAALKVQHEKLKSETTGILRKQSDDRGLGSTLASTIARQTNAAQSLVKGASIASQASTHVPLTIGTSASQVGQVLVNPLSRAYSNDWMQPKAFGEPVRASSYNPSSYVHPAIPTHASVSTPTTFRSPNFSSYASIGSSTSTVTPFAYAMLGQSLSSRVH